MAKKATGKPAGGGSKSSAKRTSERKPARAVAKRSSASRGGGSAQDSMSDAFIKLLQSPLVADLVAVAATAALAALAEHGFSSRGATGDKRRAGRAVKEAGKAAAAAIGRRLGNELEEIRTASKKSRADAGA